VQIFANLKFSPLRQILFRVSGLSQLCLSYISRTEAFFQGGMYLTMMYSTFRRAVLSLLTTLAIAFGVASAHAQDLSATSTTPASETAQNGPVAAPDLEYRLGAGDKVRVIVFGEDDLGGQYEVDGTGFLRMPLIGQVKAGGLNVHEFEAGLKQKLEEGYLKDARVSAEVVTYRPFYIIGEVNKPGEYPYSNGMNVLNAVAVAGGYTYRANDGRVFVRRSGASEEETLPADQTTRIYPGDILRIAERFF